MRIWGLLIGFLAGLILVLPGLTAQEEKKEPEKAAEKKADAEKKEPEKKGEEKKDAEKKDPEKKDEEKTNPEKKDSEKGKKEAKKAEEKLVYGRMIEGKIVRMDGNSSREFAIEVPVLDPERVYQFKVWQAEQMRHVATAPNVQERAQRTFNYQRDAARRQNELHVMKPLELRAADNVKVRSMYPPLQYDDRGNLKRWTQKDLAALRGKTTLPGYPAEIDILRQNQRVQVYIAKPPAPTPSKGGAPAARKKEVDEAPVEERPEVVMIVVVREAPMAP